jgi:hypothetical protein
VPVLPDDRFENYLRQFRPLPAGQMQIERSGPRQWQARTLVACAAIAAVVLIALLILYPRARPPQPDVAVRGLGGAGVGNFQPLTIQSANALLTRALSFKAAVDDLAIPSPKSLLQGKQSAFDALSKDAKL